MLALRKESITCMLNNQTGQTENISYEKYFSGCVQE